MVVEGGCSYSFSVPVPLTVCSMEWGVCVGRAVTLWVVVGSCSSGSVFKGRTHFGDIVWAGYREGVWRWGVWSVLYAVYVRYV